MSFNVIALKDGHKIMEFVRLAGEAREQAERWRAEGLQQVQVVSSEGATVTEASLKALERAEAQGWFGKTAA